MPTRRKTKKCTTTKRGCTHTPRTGTKKRGGYVGLAKMGIGLIPDVYRLAASGVGSQGGNSAGSKAARMRYGAPLLSRYR